MLPYPPYRKPGTAEQSLPRVLGGVLALLSILLALLGIILHQRVTDLMLAFIVGLFALRVLIVWLGDTPQHQRPSPRWSTIAPVRHPGQPPAHALGSPAAPASPYFQSQPFSQRAPEQPTQPTAPLPDASVPPPLPALPRSIRPQRPPIAPAFWAQPAPPPQGVQPLPPALPPFLRLSTPYSKGSLPFRQETWQYDDGESGAQQQREKTHGTL